MSHAIVAVPFRGTALPVAAVAVGSMAPDAVLFAPFLPPYRVAHSVLGVLTIDLAVALVVLGCWWWLVRPAWSRALPEGVQRRLPAGWRRPEPVPWRRVPLVVVGVLLGATSHVLWDASSHADGWFVARLPALRATYGSEPGYSLVQDGSSALGLLALLALAVVWWRGRRRHTPAPVSPVGREARLVLPTSAAVVVLVTLVRVAVAVAAGGGATDVVVTAAYTVPRAVALVLVLGALVVVWSERRTAGHPGSIPRVSEPERDGSGPGGSEPDGQERRQVGP